MPFKLQLCDRLQLLLQVCGAFGQQSHCVRPHYAVLATTHQRRCLGYHIRRSDHLHQRRLPYHPGFRKLGQEYPNSRFVSLVLSGQGVRRGRVCFLDHQDTCDRGADARVSRH